MPNPKDLRTEAFVLRRTNFGEADRILTLLTPEGKLSVLARGVRKPKSKLAGSIEMFCRSEIVVHQGKSKLGILTGAKMLVGYTNLLADFESLELATNFLKQLNRITEQISDPKFFDLLAQSLPALNSASAPISGATINSTPVKSSPNSATKTLVSAWFDLNLAKLIGEEPNLYFDKNGQKLDPETAYVWDSYEKSLVPDPAGEIAKNEVKFARLMLASPLALVQKVENPEPYLKRLAPLLKCGII